MDANNAHYKAVDDVIFTKDGKKLIYCPANKRGSYEVPEGTETIVYEAFYYSCLKSITLPESVSLIEDYAFTESEIEEIRGVSGSYAEEYADSEGFLFVNADAEEEDDDDDDRNPSARRRMDVVLIDAGENRLQVIKLLKKHCGMGAAEAKAVMDSAPAVIKHDVDKDTAQWLVYYFNCVGAKMKVK